MRGPAGARTLSIRVPGGRPRSSRLEAGPGGFLDDLPVRRGDRGFGSTRLPASTSGKLDPPRDPPLPHGHAPAEAWSVPSVQTARSWRLRAMTISSASGIRVSGVEHATLRGPDSLVTAIAWSPDGLRLASASLDKDRGLCLWDRGLRIDGVRALRPTKPLSEPWHSVPTGAPSPPGGDDHTVRLWDPESGRLLATLTDHSGRVCAVAFSSGWPDPGHRAGWTDGILLTDLLTLRSRDLAIGLPGFGAGVRPGRSDTRRRTLRRSAHTLERRNW